MGRAADPFGGPLKIAIARQRVLVGPVTDAKVVRRRRDNRRDRTRRQPAEQVDGVAKVKAEGRAARLEGCMGLWVTRHRPRLYRGDRVAPLKGCPTGES